MSRNTTAKFSRARLHGILIASLIMTTTTPIPAWSIDFASELLVYREDFLGEVAYPTTPEINTIGAAGVLGFAIPGPSEPVLTGTVASASLVEGGDVITGIAIIGGPVGLEPIGFRGRYSNLSIADPDAVDIRISTAAGFDDPAGVAGGSVRADLEIGRDALSVASGFILVTELDHATVMETFSLTNLSASEAAAIEGGSAFTLDLLVDRVAGTATSTLDIPGFSTRTAGPLNLNSIDPFENSGSSQQLLSGTAGPPSADAVSVDLTDIEIYRIFSTSFTVDTNVDEVDSSIGDGLCEAASGNCSLRAAIQESNAVPGPGEIIVPADTYVLSIPGAGESVAATGDLDISDDLVLRGAGRNSTIIDGGGIDRVFELRVAFPNPEPEAHLLDLTVQNGAAVTSAGAIGGGIENRGRLILERCIIANNQANLAGGIMNRRSLFMNDCVVTENEALNLGFTNAKAGGLASGSTSASGPNVVAIIRNSAIVNNTAPFVGGIEFGNAVSALVENTTIAGNTSQQVNIFNCDVEFQHVTIVSDNGPGLSAGSFSGTNTLEFVNTAIDALPSCSLSTSFPILTTYSGNNASSDTSCGFSSAGSVEGVPLGLMSLISVAGSKAHPPMLGSVLIDSADLTTCLAQDQLGTARPFDGDNNGTAECDIGAIEVPEPTFGLSILFGLAALLAMGRKRNTSLA